MKCGRWQWPRTRVQRRRSSSSVARGASRRLGGDRTGPGQVAVDLFDRAAARLEAYEPEGEGPEHVPEGEIEKAQDQRIERRLRLDVVGGAGDQRETGRTDEFADIADAIDKSHAAAAQPRRPEFAHIGADDRIVAAAEKALQQQHDVKD